MKAVIRPSRASGRVSAPPSKSMGHRLLICAGLAEGKSTVKNVGMSQDILATLDCLRALGAGIEISGQDINITGTGGGFAGSDLYCRESGSTLRFFIPICLLSRAQYTLYGSGRLLERPLSIYEDICKEQDLGFKKSHGSLSVRGPLLSGDFRFAGNVSSQFVSGLLFALPLLDRDSRIHLIPPVESRSYIDMTMHAQSLFGVRTYWENENTIMVPGGQRYAGGDVSVEGDYSNSAFLEAFNMVGGDVTVLGLKESSLQGDSVYRELYKKLSSGRPVIDLSDCPDLGPVLFALASALNGASFTGTERLRIKESDRIQAMKDELIKLGADLETEGDTVSIPGSVLHRPDVPLSGHNDHRIVMALSVLLSLTGGTIEGAEAVSKSFPDFFDILRRLNIEVDLYD